MKAAEVDLICSHMAGNSDETTDDHSIFPEGNLDTTVL